jgi:hypothetical protein
LIDVPGLGVLVLAGAEWLGLGWLSGISFARPEAWPRWALRLLVGSCLVAAAQLVLAAVGLGLGSIPLVLLVAALGALVVRVLRRPLRHCLDGGSGAPQAEASPPSPGERRAERLGWLLLGGVLIGAVVRSLVVPEAGWDAYSHWGLRAQAYTLAGTIVDARSEHEYYPPLVPLLEAWLYLHRGAVAIDLGKTVWAVIGGAFGVCLAWHFRLSLRSAWLAPILAAGVVLSTTALLESFWTGQADLPLTAYLTLATLAVWRYEQGRGREPAWLVQAAIFGAAAALTKFEGLPRVGVVVLALGVEGALARQRAAWRAAVVLALAAAFGTALWVLVELSRGIAPNGEHMGAVQPLALGSVLVALLAVFGGVRTGGGLLVAGLAWAVAGRQLLLGELRLLSLVVVGQLAATLVGFLLSATSPELEGRTSATRLFEQFLPLALFVGAVGLARTLHL